MLNSTGGFRFYSGKNGEDNKKISNTLTSKGISTSNHTVEKYITAYLESYLINKYERFYVKEKIYYPEIINIMQLIQD